MLTADADKRCWQKMQMLTTAFSSGTDHDQKQPLPLSNHSSAVVVLLAPTNVETTVQDC